MRTDFERNALAAHAAQRLAGPAQALLGLHELLNEQAGTSGLDDLRPDLDRIGTAVGQLNALIGDLMKGRSALPDATREPIRIRHDLRTPLNAIIGYSELLLEDIEVSAGEELQDDLEALLKTAGELLTRVDAIADLFAASSSGAAADEAATGLDAASLQTSIAGEAAMPAVRGAILVVDDVAGNRELLSRRLSREGHSVTTADGGTSALELLGEREFDLVLLDVLMPDMNGIEVLRRLKADGSRRHMPVIMISGLDDADAVARCIESGADDYLPKPFNPVFLKARINAVLERKHWLDRERRYIARIEAEQKRADALLHAVLPGQIVARLKNGEQVIADRFERRHRSVRRHRRFLPHRGQPAGNRSRRSAWGACSRPSTPWRNATRSRRSRRSATPTWPPVACRIRSTTMPTASSPSVPPCSRRWKAGRRRKASRFASASIPAPSWRA